MGNKKNNPTSPGLRHKMISDYSEITTDEPCRELLENLPEKAGRSRGRISVRHKGGGHKQKYRVIDFKRDKTLPGKVATIEYDPNRSANIALINYPDGEKRYILAPKGLNVGDTVISGEEAELEPGHCLKIEDIPLGLPIHNLEVKPSKGGQIARSAGNFATITSKEGKYAIVKMPSGKKRKFNMKCKATIGQMGRIEHETEKSGKAGRSRWKGKRPRVRGVSMNPVDHPMGGGEGLKAGGRHPCSPWGQIAKGKKTRKNKRTDKFNVES